MPVNYQQPEFILSIPIVKKCRDSVAGSQAIKGGTTDYMPMINPSDKSVANMSRYKQLVELALYTNFTGRTVEALNGALWRKPATIELPTSLEYMRDNCDGGGLSLEQFAKDITFDIQQSGRFGILIEYVNGLAQFNPYIHESIINVRKKGGKYVLIVLKQEYSDSDDGFEAVMKEEFLVLALVDDVYTQSIYREGEIFGKVITPLDYNGQPYGDIQFVFAGSKNNDETIDIPPIYSLAEVNIAHYRNSGSVERSGWIMGEPMLVISPGDNLQADHFKNDPIVFGAASGVNVGTNGNAMILQANPNTLAQSLQKEKVEQMLLIGARLAETTSTNETATGAEIRHGAETSVLSTIAGNVSAAFEMAFEMAESTMSESVSGDVKFAIGTEFFSQSPDAQLLTVLLQIADRGKYMPQDDFIALLKRYGLLDSERNLEELKNDLTLESPIL